jgi:hypothetical protein
MDPKNELFGKFIMLAPIVAGAILLHHESRLVRTLLWAGDVELRWEHILLYTPDTVQLIHLTDLSKFLEWMINYRGQLKGTYTCDEIIESIMMILSYLNYHPRFPAYLSRALVGSIVSIIAVCDSLCARSTRGKSERRLTTWETLLNKWGRGFE